MNAPVGTPFKVTSARNVPAASTVVLTDVDFPSAVSQYTVQVQVGEPFTVGNIDVQVSGGLDQVSYPGMIVNVFTSGTAAVAMSMMGQTYENVRFSVTNTDTIAHTVTVWALAK